MTPLGEMTWSESSAGLTAQGKLPRDAEYFKDHFPAFPVLPGVLAIEILKCLGQHFLNRKAGNPQFWKMTGLKQARFSAFLRPGDSWEAALDYSNSEGGRQIFKGRLVSQGKTAVQAQFILEAIHNVSAV